MTTDKELVDNRLSVAPDNEAKGSVYFGNTSYSGADIKLVLNIYDGGKAYKEHIKDLEEQLRSSDAKLKVATEDLNKTKTKINTGKAATPEFTRRQKTASDLADKITSYQRDTVSLTAEISRLNKIIPKSSTKVLAEAQTLSLSVHRDKRAVRSCGSVYAKGYTRGPREIAGSIIFTVFNEHVLYEFLAAHASDFDAYKSATAALMDQLPPVDITIAFANEYGQLSRMAIRGVEFINEGQTMSIEDIMTENVVQFVARDYDPMRSVSARKVDEANRLISAFQSKKASDLLLESDFLKTKRALSPFKSFQRRRFPFL